MLTNQVRLLLVPLILCVLSGCFGPEANKEIDSVGSTAENPPITEGSESTHKSAEAGGSANREPKAETAGEQESEPAELATNFTMQTLGGDELSLEALRGRYVLVNFWATWCIPCRKEMPYLQQISDKYDGQLVVLGVNMREKAERVQPFIDEMGLTIPILLNPPNELLLEHNVRGLPISYIVDPEGAIVYRKIGEILPEEFDPWLHEHLEQS
ncbi:MAG: TlpA disulfide reductase family protein [Chloroflexota bacterium]